MARFVNALLLCSGFVVSASGPAQAGSVDPGSLPIINGHVTLEEFRTLSRSAAVRDCTDTRCKTLRSLLSSYDKLRRFYTPNTMSRSEDNPPPTKRPRLPIQDLISDDVGQQAIIFDDLVIIGRDITDWSSELLTIEIATLTDKSGQTARRVIAAIPKTPALSGVVKAALERCETNAEQGCRALEKGG